MQTAIDKNDTRATKQQQINVPKIFAAIILALISDSETIKWHVCKTKIHSTKVDHHLLKECTLLHDDLLPESFLSRLCSHTGCVWGSIHFVN